ncbi:ribosomal RNA large subunit methyltransferase I [Pigmentiphaga litoralis]|jgi:23S rRNA (cytosine1962-C5)-methyltransferase|uniref:class I SAM-dependent rRNA methyltransferase n=1 Tax=Pigmentiphaga litoralis TaxID=516702 RepID=UPI001674695D|nr:class I SAM-dependent methyltransferase [Pigmentiphaga litoralis]GGX20335.1 ribosomal RNA large subunit methyltransferase I [Pigmentiphaga litoralis]
MSEVVLKSGKERSLLRRHPWVYATGIAQTVGRPLSGDTVRVVDDKGRFLAWGAFSPESQIRVRCWSFNEQDTIDAAWMAQRVHEAVARRSSLAARSNGARVVFGEADGLPGFVADRYAGQLVVQFLAAGVERWREALVDGLVAATGCTQVYERSDAAVREREGLESRVGPMRGDAPSAPIEIVEDGVRYGVDVLHGHKTGFYLDQRESRKRVAELAAQIGPSATILNCFSYTGGFSLAAMKAGAARAISVDSSADALAAAAQNAARNDIDPAAFECRISKVADAQRALAAEGQQFDIVVLDPPKFAPSAHHVDKAARAYKDVNLKGMRLVKPGGYLLTFSCSGAITVDLFQKIVAGAVTDSHLEFVLLERLAAGIDHPMRMTHPEGEYLKGLLLQRV